MASTLTANLSQEPPHHRSTLTQGAGSSMDVGQGLNATGTVIKTSEIFELSMSGLRDRRLSDNIMY